MGADALIEQLRSAAAEPVCEVNYVQDYMRSYERQMQDIVWDFARLIRLCGGLEGKRVVDIGS